jgi:S-adenosylmethionine-dependent methyltransferase
MSRDGEDTTTGFTAGEAEWRAFASHGLVVRAWYGVRVFTDVAASDAPPPADLDVLLDCDERAGRTDPYRGVAALTHVIATPA